MQLVYAQNISFQRVAFVQTQRQQNRSKHMLQNKLHAGSLLLLQAGVQSVISYYSRPSVLIILVTYMQLMRPRTARKCDVHNARIKKVFNASSVIEHCIRSSGFSRFIDLRANLIFIPITLISFVIFFVMSDFRNLLDGFLMSSVPL